jgi:hypothetical protein
LGRAWRSKSDEKLEESSGVCLGYGRVTVVGTASELNVSQGSGYLRVFCSLGYYEVCTIQVPRQLVLSYGHLLGTMQFVLYRYPDSWCCHMDICWVQCSLHYTGTQVLSYGHL